MEDKLSLCVWPQLPPRYDKALRECVEFLLGRYEVTALMACGTIIMGNPDASSDLDVVVLHRADYKQRVQRFFNGVPTEMFVNPVAQMYINMDIGVADLTPHSAHMIAHGFTVLDVADDVAAMRARAIELLKQEPAVNEEDLVQHRYRAACLLEDAVDMRERDPETAELILGEAMRLMLEHCFRRERRYIPRKKELLDALRSVNPEVAKAARRFYSSQDLAERIELAGRIADSTIQARGFFEWESPRAAAKS